MEMAYNEFARSKRYDKPVSIIMMDIDHFKKVNDNYGHLLGDTVLQAVAEQIKVTLRETDLPGRYGGEEFIALLPETAIDEAQLVAERVREAVQGHDICADDYHIRVTSSFGVSCAACNEGKFKPVEVVIDDADKALYKAKSAGRNRVVVL